MADSDPDLTVRLPAQAQAAALFRDLKDNERSEVSGMAEVEGSTSAAETPELAGPAVPAQSPLAAQRYEVRERLGRGGGGQVFAVYDRHLSREIAVKVTHHERVIEAELARFVAEAQLTAQLEHPNILPIYDLGCDKDGRWFFSMRRARGHTLSELVKRAAHGDVPPEIAGFSDRVDVLVRVCDAIAYAHSRGVVHRDIKPSNIILGEFGEVTVLDWGTALDCNQPLPAERKIIGTPLYMAPEQARGELADERSDVYCLGATLYQLLTLQRPIAVASDAETESFWEAKFAGCLPEPPPNVPGALIEIARRALAVEPLERYQKVAEFREALRTWQRQKTSLAFCERAEAALAESAAAKDYAYFARMTEGFENALAEWSGNERARRGLSLARAAHARFALRRGDLELASELLDAEGAEHEELAKELEQARKTARAARSRQRWLRVALAAAVLLVLAGVALFLHERRLEQGAWHVAYVFEKGRMPNLEATVTERPERVSLEKGALVLTHAQLYFMEDVEVWGNVRFDAEIEWLESVDGFEVAVRSRKEKPPQFWQVPAGYSCQFGGHSGAMSFISENRVAGNPSTAESLYIPFVPKRRYRLTFSIVEDEAMLYVDGTEKLRVRSLLPLGDSSYRHIALRTWGGKVALHRIEISRQALPQKPGPLIAGDSLAAAGNLLDAARTYRQIAADFRGSETAEHALARAFLASATAREPSAERAPLLDRLRSEHPASKHLKRCDESAVLDAWQEGRLDEALRLAEGVLTLFPESRLAPKLLESRRPLDKEQTRRLLALLGRTRDIARIDVPHMDIDDFSFLDREDLQTVYLTGTRIADLSVLKRAKLREIGLRGTLVRDLGPLRGMPLRSVDVSHTGVSDLSPLSEAPLRWLGIARSAVSDLSPLRKAELRYLDCDYTEVRDLSPLRGMPLEELTAEGARIDDVSALRGLPLRIVNLARNRITDVSSLGGDRTYERIVLNENPVADLSPLSMTSGTQLMLDGTKVSDLRPLVGWERITLNRAPVRDLTPVRHARELVLGGQAYKLAPLAGTRLQELSLGRAVIKDPGILAELPHLRKLSAMDSLRPREIDELVKRLEQRVQKQTEEDKQRKAELVALIDDLRLQAAILRRDVKYLRSRARTGAGVQMLALPLWLDLPAARALTTSLEATLPRLGDARVRAFVESELPLGGLYWLDIAQRDTGLHWGDGLQVEPGYVEPVPDGSPVPAAGYYVTRYGNEWYRRCLYADEDRAAGVIAVWSQ
jgi:hypothetical protein